MERGLQKANHYNQLANGCTLAAYFSSRSSAKNSLVHDVCETGGKFVYSASDKSICPMETGTYRFILSKTNGLNCISLTSLTVYHKPKEKIKRHRRLRKDNSDA